MPNKAFPKSLGEVFAFVDPTPGIPYFGLS